MHDVLSEPGTKVQDFHFRGSNEAPFVRKLYEAIGMPEASVMIVRHGWILRLLSAEQHTRELAKLKAFAAQQRGRLISVSVRFVNAAWADVTAQ